MRHSSSDELEKILKEAQKKVKVGDVYFHYKNPEQHYKIESLGFWEKTEEVCVCYRWLYGPRLLFIRTVENFLEEVEVEGKRVRRFQIIL